MIILSNIKYNIQLGGDIIFKVSQKKSTLIVAVASQLLIQLIANMTVIALPDIAVELNFSAEALLWVNIIYLMSFVAFSLPLKRIHFRIIQEVFQQYN